MHPDVAIQIVMTPYDEAARPKRLAVGDVVRCADFAWGFRWKDASKPVAVAWHAMYRREHQEIRERNGDGTIANDPSRGAALFLITRIEMHEGSGPSDWDPENHWLARYALGTRLAADLTFTAASERVTFAMEDGMSLLRANETQIEIMGYAALPVRWVEPIEEG